MFSFFIFLYFFYSLGMQYRFDVIFDDGEHELQIGEYFLERMRQWRRIRGT